MTWKSFFFTCLLGLSLPLTISSSVQANDFTISNVSGTVESRWRFSLFWRRAAQHAELGSDYRLRVGDHSSVTIACLDINGDWIKWIANTRGEVQIYERCAVRVRPGRATAPTRSPIDETLPYVISPRNTALLLGNINIVWNGVPDASTYRVSIRGREFLWQSGWLTETETQLPASLASGRTYEIAVETDQGVSSSPDGLASPTFNILADEKVGTINQKVAQIEALKLDSTAQALVVAQLYREHNLNQNAIALLEAQAQSGQQSAAIYQLQASIYEQIGLTRQAQQRYSNALELTDPSDLEQRANIQEHLGLLARSRANHLEAIKWLQSAEATYLQQLDTSLSEVQTRLQELNTLIKDSQARLPASDSARHSVTP